MRRVEINSDVDKRMISGSMGLSDDLDRRTSVSNRGYGHKRGNDDDNDYLPDLGSVEYCTRISSSMKGGHHSDSRNDVSIVSDEVYDDSYFVGTDASSNGYHIIGRPDHHPPSKAVSKNGSRINSRRASREIAPVEDEKDDKGWNEDSEAKAWSGGSIPRRSNSLDLLSLSRHND